MKSSYKKFDAYFVWIMITAMNSWLRLWIHDYGYEFMVTAMNIITKNNKITENFFE